MPRNWKDKARSYARRFIIASGFTLLLGLLSIFSGLAYSGNARIVASYPNEQLLYIDSEIVSNVTYNPFLFPFYWLTGKGLSSYHFMMRSVPVAATQNGVAWPRAKDITDDAMLIISLNALFANILYNFVILLAAELLKIRRVYFCLLGGMIGFPLAGPIGSLISFFTAVLLVVLIMPKFKKNKYFTDLWDSITKPKQRRSAQSATA
jgi:hypothetical protein